jgi:glycosyltransferase involved in cell wall biosynthesis
MKILFIQPYPTEGASARYRVEQYVPYLENKGIECAIRPFISAKFYKILYKRGFCFKKILYFIQSSIQRFFDIFLAMRSDLIFIHLEAFPLGPPFLEHIFVKILHKKIIYDLDDAIYIGNTSSANNFLKYLKCPSKIKKIIKLSSHVIACNEHLASYAKKYNNKVAVIHTSVDTDKFKPISREKKENIVIGWMGSHSTAKYLSELKNVFLKLSAKHKFTVKIIGAGEGYDFEIPGINVVKLDWSLKDEIAHFQSFDIGVYPLPENEWTKGKTGFKTIQYMSVGIPCVVSDIGANKHIIKDGVNGYLAKTEEEWVEKIYNLIQDPNLRMNIGLQGRKTAEEKYSLKVSAFKFLEVIKTA